MQFTFQYGEIKSKLRGIRNNVRVRFTFQYGEIKRRLSTVAYVDLMSYLHSSMERLKGANEGTCDKCPLKFTFQYGEIKRLGN